MKRIILLIQLFTLAFFIGTPKSQTVDWDCGQVSLQKVTAKSGLVLRSLPSTDSKKILLIPPGAKVLVGFDHQLSVLDSIEGEEGYWMRAKFANTEGFVFDAFLEKETQYSVFYDPEMNMPSGVKTPFAGLFAGNEMETGLQDFDLFQVEEKITASSGEESFYPELDVDYERFPSFFLSGISTQKTVVNGHYFDYSDGILFPGKIQQLYFNGTHYSLFASGEVEQVYATSEDAWMNLRIKDYKIILEKRSPDATEQQVIYRAKEGYVSDWGTHGIANVRFAGDLDGDELPDFILESGLEMGYEIQLLLSSEADKGFLVKLVFLMMGSCC